jgi:hypothetical protein
MVGPAIMPVGRSNIAQTAWMGRCQMGSHLGRAVARTVVQQQHFIGERTSQRGFYGLAEKLRVIIDWNHHREHLAMLLQVVHYRINSKRRSGGVLLQIRDGVEPGSGIAPFHNTRPQKVR